MSKPCQIHLQTMNLIKNVHQNLSLSHLNGQDMIQRRMSESSEVVDGGTLAAVAATALEVSAALVEEGGGGTLLEDAPRETEGSALR